MEDMAMSMVDLDVNNRETITDLPLEGDFNRKNRNQTMYYLPIIYIIIAFILSFVYPNATENIEIEIPKNTKQIFSFSVPNISALNQYVDIEIDAHKSGRYMLDGTANITLYDNFKNESSNYTILTSTPMKSPITLFRNDIMSDYKANVTLNLTNLDSFSKITISYFNSSFSFALVIFKTCLCVIMAIHLLFYIRNTTDSKHPTTFEQNLTAALGFITFMALDPLSFADTTSTGIVNVIRKTLTRDAAVSYACFYCLSIFYYFTRDVTESPALSVAMPYVYMFMMGSFLLATDATVRLTGHFEMFPILSGPIFALNELHLLFISIFEAALAFIIYKARKSAKPSSKQRLWNYLVFVLPFALFLFIAAIIGGFWPKSSLAQILPLSVLAALAHSSLHAHRSVDEKLTVYDMPGGESQTDGALFGESDGLYDAVPDPEIPISDTEEDDVEQIENQTARIENITAQNVGGITPVPESTEKNTPVEVKLDNIPIPKPAPNEESDDIFDASAGGEEEEEPPAKLD